MDKKTASESPVRIAVVVAGTNDPSNSDMLAGTMAEAMQGSGKASVEKVLLKDVDISHFNLGCYGTECAADGMTAVEKMIRDADGVVLASPVWNFSVPAHFKNLIDRMGAFALDESRSIGTLAGKPFFIILTGGMPAAAWPFVRRNLQHLSTAIQYFGGSVLGIHFEGGCTLGRGKFGLVVDKRPKSLQAMREKGIAFLKQVERFKHSGSLPLIYVLKRRAIRLMQKTKKKLGL